MLQINTLSRLDLGVKDENNARDLQIDMNAWYTDYPNGSFSIWHKRNGDQTKYAASGVVFDRETGILTWTPDAYDTFYIGKGLAEIRCTENEVIKKTKDIGTEVARSLVLGSGETLAAGWQNFLNAVESAKNGAEQAQKAAEEAQAAAEEAQGTAEENAEDAAGSAEDAEAWATGKRGGEDVGSGDPTYHNNAKYYSQEAAGSAEDAADAAEAAEAAKGDAETAQGNAARSATEAEAAAAAAESAVAHYPYVDPVTGDWMVWDADDGQFVDTGIRAEGPKGDTGTVPNIAVGTVTTLLPGEPATVVRRSGSPDTAPIFDFGIPKGDTGQAGNIYGNTIDMSEEDSTKVATAIRGKISKVEGGTSGNFAALDENGELTDSGHKHSDYLTSQDITGKADKDLDAVTGNFAAFDAEGNPVDSGHNHSDYLTQHQDISGKADKVTGAAAGNLAALDGAGNLVDSGKDQGYYAAVEDIEDGDVIAGVARELYNDEIVQDTDEFSLRVAQGNVDAITKDAQLITIKGKHSTEGGVITQSKPTAFRIFGWNLYNPVTGSCQVVKYSSTKGFKITGSYTTIAWMSTPQGADTQYITPSSDGSFTIPDSGYLSVFGGGADTRIWMTGDEWIQQANDGVYEAYSASNISFATMITTNFTAGLCEVGSVQDELNFVTHQAIKRIGQMEYSAENLAAVQAMDVDYEYDSTNIFYVLPEEVIYELDVDGRYTARSHGMEGFGGPGKLPPEFTIRYSENLKDMILENRERILDLQDETETQAAEIAKGKQTLGIVEEGNTATQTISAGQYVVWKGKLYTADANISIGTTLAATGGSKNLTEKTSGGLNDLKSVTDTLNSKIITNNGSQIVNNSVNVSSSWGYLISFTITHVCALRVIQTYNASAPTGVAVTSSSSTMTNTLLAINEDVYNAAILHCILPPGTYYVWGKASGSGSNRIVVYAIQLMPNS